MPLSPSLRGLLYEYRNHSSQLRQLHALLITTGFFLPSICTAGEADGAGATFAYNTLIGASSLHRQSPCHSGKTPALQLFVEMLAHQALPNSYTFPPLIKSIIASVSPSPLSSLPAMFGRAVHGQAVRRGVVPDNFVNCCMVRLYGQLEDLVGALKVFEENPQPDVASCNAVLDASCKNGDVRSAVHIFGEMRGRDIISWTTLLNGFLVNGRFIEGIHLFREMMLGVSQGAAASRPNEATFVCVLSACAHSDAGKAPRGGRDIHGHIVRRGVRLTPFLGTALIDMYGKCGKIHNAAKVFERMAEKEVCTWNAMISALGRNGEEAHALDLFEQMKTHQMQPNGITFVALLTACARSQSINRGLELFESMSRSYGVVPVMEHYGCMVDLLGRAGLFEKATDLIWAMPFEPDASVWGALLGACKMHRNKPLAAGIGQRLLALQPHHPGRYVVLSNIYADVGMWSSASRMKEEMEKAGIKKIAGRSWLEVPVRTPTY